MTDYLNKPPNYNKFVAKFKKLMNRSRKERERKEKNLAALPGKHTIRN